MNKDCINHIEFDVLDRDMYRKRFNYYNKLYEKHDNDDKFKLRRVMRHELFHSKQTYSTNKDISNSDFNNDDEYERLFDYVYIFAENEQEAFRNEIYQLVFDMDDEELNEYRDLYQSYTKYRLI